MINTSIIQNTMLPPFWNTRDKNTEKYPGAGHLFPQWSLYAVPEWRRQEQVILYFQ